MTRPKRTCMLEASALHKSIQKQQGMILRWNHPALCYSVIYSRSFSHVPAAAGGGDAGETIFSFSCISAQKEVCVTHPHRLPFAFSEQALQAAFLQFVYTTARKMRDFKGSIPLTLGFQ